MSRLPPKPDLVWQEDGTPVDQRVGDVYFSRHNGLEETRAVFLKGCGLPERWHGRTTFTIGELGFGTGLNFLAAWQLWQQTRAPGQWLHFVSFEGYPLDRDDARRALSAWPELGDVSQKLIDAWPARAFGVQRVSWPEDGVTLTLHTGPIEETLPRSVLRADAWFLDGFSPAKNADMWTSDLWPQLHARCAPGAVAATFTVAGAVRRGLAEAGFNVEKKPGFGRKRERLEVRAAHPPAPEPDTHGLRPLDRRPDKVRILGAGIAGACAARKLLDRGLDVEVIDAASGPASAASGNPLALVMPRLDAADTVQARLLIDAYLAALRFYAGRPGVHVTDVTHQPKDEKEAERIAKVLADPPLPLEYLEALAGGAQLHKQSLIIEPRRLIPALLEGAQVRYDEKIAPEALDPDVPTLIACGQSLQAFAPWMALEGRLGQVEYCDAGLDAPPSALASGHYALACGTQRLWGATFERMENDAAEISAAARAVNMEALERLDPYWRQQINNAPIDSRAGVRATTPDRMPLIGRVPDHAGAMEMFDTVRHGQPVAADAPLRENLFVAGGFGSRGFTWGPWAGDIIAAQLLSEPAPETVGALQAVSPMRQILRALKRGG